MKILIDVYLYHIRHFCLQKWTIFQHFSRQKCPMWYRQTSIKIFTIVRVLYLGMNTPPKKNNQLAFNIFILKLYFTVPPNNIFRSGKNNFTFLIYEFSRFWHCLAFHQRISPLRDINFIYFLNGKTHTFNFAAIFI